MRSRIYLAIGWTALLFSLSLAAACRSGDDHPETQILPVPGEVGQAESLPNNPDLQQYPMPESLPGLKIVLGSVEVFDEIRPPATGNTCELEARLRGDSLDITIPSMRINCCAEEIRASVELLDSVAEIRIWEYMPDVCECFHSRALRFTLAPFDPAGLSYRLFSNARIQPCGYGEAFPLAAP